MPNGKPNILILWGDEHLPTHHGFDEFFGNLYHLNAEEVPQRSPALRASRGCAL